MQNKFPETLVFILKKMCEFVGADYDKMDFHKSDWFFDYLWTNEKQEEFIIWLTDYFQKDKKARNELLNLPSKNKKTCREAARWFVFVYGWRLND